MGAEEKEHEAASLRLHMGTKPVGRFNSMNEGQRERALLQSWLVAYSSIKGKCVVLPLKAENA